MPLSDNHTKYLFKMAHKYFLGLIEDAHGNPYHGDIITNRVVPLMRTSLLGFEELAEWVAGDGDREEEPDERFIDAEDAVIGPSYDPSTDSALSRNATTCALEMKAIIRSIPASQRSAVLKLAGKRPYVPKSFDDEDRRCARYIGLASEEREAARLLHADVDWVKVGTGRRVLVAWELWKGERTRAVYEGAMRAMGVMPVVL
ncbi:hypothetical protein BJ508DRAFT_310997 [Ascobolus immersus RN42]|uniref:Uncharacterized protein n=1 Tax=Ascobolus immersus RN42 TaxID=1160509 RepID=A0A3N4HS04_ASCIM|nr:hypothetical protein BJ508DRAFT_310997 [Ascobolus immersus RN42]